MHRCDAIDSNFVVSTMLTTVFQLQTSGSHLQDSHEREAHKLKTLASRMLTTDGCEQDARNSNTIVSSMLKRALGL